MVIGQLLRITKNTQHELYNFKIKFDRSYQNWYGFSRVFSFEELYYAGFEKYKISKINYSTKENLFELEISNEQQNIVDDELTLGEFKGTLSVVNDKHISYFHFTDEWKTTNIYGKSKIESFIGMSCQNGINLSLKK